MDSRYRSGVDAQGKRWWTVFGSRVQGPFNLFVDAKKALGIPAGYQLDERIESGALYRYHASFIGTAKALHERNIHHMPWEREAPTREAQQTPVRQSCCNRMEALNRVVRTDGWKFCPYCGTPNGGVVQRTQGAPAERR